MNKYEKTYTDADGKVITCNPRYIVCAACKVGNIMFVGPRHWDKTMREQVSLLMGEPDKVVAFKKLFDTHSEYLTTGKRDEQGFIDQYGDFWTREEAAEIVTLNGQHLRNHDHGGMLYSEDLY